MVSGSVVPAVEASVDASVVAGAEVVVEAPVSAGGAFSWLLSFPLLNQGISVVAANTAITKTAQMVTMAMGM